MKPDTTFSTLGDQRIFGTNKISPAIVFGGLGVETDANARLIAAAPELLLALRAVIESARPHPREHPTMFRAWDIARAAIDKAEGRQ
jgi:hypothetical protein